MASSNLGKKDLIPAIVWMILGLLVVIGSYKLGIGHLHNPGSGLMPFLFGIFLIFVSLLLLVQSLRNIRAETRKEESIWAGVELWRMSVIVAIQLAYGLILERVGFSAATFCCLFILFKFSGSERVVKALIATSITVILSYLLFIVILKTQMPSFPWEILF